MSSATPNLEISLIAGKEFTKRVDQLDGRFELFIYNVTRQLLAGEMEELHGGWQHPSKDGKARGRRHLPFIEPNHITTMPFIPPDKTGMSLAVFPEAILDSKGSVQLSSGFVDPQWADGSLRPLVSIKTDNWLDERRLLHSERIMLHLLNLDHLHDENHKAA